MYAKPFPHPSGATAPTIAADLLPRHVAIVMDGNGRWANARGLPRTKGHEAGEASLLDVVAGAIDVGVTHLSAYAFSTENWRRSPDEVRFLMGFNRDVIRRRRDQLHEWGVRMRWVGRAPRLWRSVIKELEVAQELTQHNTGLTLYFCVNYGGGPRSPTPCSESPTTSRAVGSGRAPSTRRRSSATSTSPTCPTSTSSCAARGAAHEQLPAVAVGLRGDGVPEPALARLRPARPLVGDRGLRRPRPPLRRSRRHARCPRRAGATLTGRRHPDGPAPPVGPQPPACRWLGPVSVARASGCGCG